MRLTGSLLLVFISISGGACADEPAPVPVPQTLEEAVAQRERADALRDQAEERYLFEQNECYRKVLAAQLLFCKNSQTSSSGSGAQSLRLR